jgi:chromosome segregation ATPase
MFNQGVFKSALRAEAKLSEDERDKLARCRGELAAAEKSLEEAEAARRKLNGEELNLWKTLFGDQPMPELTAADVLEYQRQVSEARKNVEGIAAIVKKRESLVERANDEMPLLNELRQRKEDLLAEIALGSDRQQALGEITKEIDDERKRIAELERAGAEASRALPGLKRKLSEAEDALKDLESRKKKILLAYLRGEADNAAQEYSETALKLVGVYLKLTALDSLMKAQGGQSTAPPAGRLRPDGNQETMFKIPTFQLKAFEQIEDRSFPFEVYAVRLAQRLDSQQAAMAKEVKRLSNLGVKL